jgi:hypothetical protein
MDLEAFSDRAIVILTLVVMTGVMCFALLRGGYAEIRAGHRRRGGRCPDCGYDLTGLPSSRCPECGNPVEAVP